MNRFKEEQRQIFGQLRLSEERKERVIQAVPKKRRNLMPTAIFASIAAICLFFMINGLQSNEDFTSASAIEAYETFLKEHRNNMEVDIKHVELPFERNNDAIIIGIYEQEDSEAYYFQHMTFENGEWTFGLSGIAGYQRTREIDEVYLGVRYRDYAQLSNTTEEVIFAGVLANDVESIFVGDKEVKTYNIDGDHLWITFANSRGTPVYSVKNGEKKRISQHQVGDFPREPSIVYDLVGDNYAFHYTKDTMHVYDEEYTKFDIVIDPDYYTNKLLYYTDVVLVEGANGPEVVRILATNQMSSQGVSVKVQESSTLVNGTSILEPYSWAKAKGNIEYKFDQSIDYGLMGEDEVFVYPDNWLSDGVRGYVRKDQIIGKVLGYSIANIEVDWIEEEIKLYEQVKDKGTAILKTESPQMIALVQLYALQQKDYKTVQALYEGISNEHMLGYFGQMNLEMADSLIKYHAYMIKRAKFDEQRNVLVVKNSYDDSDIYKWEMVKVDGSWKVKFTSTAYQQAFN